MDIDIFRQGVVALVEYACGYDQGRTKDDPVYRAVTEYEHHVPRAKYSSCADLGHWLLYRVGVREHWINRDENGGWRDVVNISLLCTHAKDPGGKDWSPGPGDILIIANDWPMGKDAHCTVVLEVGAGVIKTGNYGVGGMSAAASPGAEISDSRFKFDGKNWRVGLRIVRKVISVADMMRLTTEPANWDGAALAGEVLEALCP
jgi:hypothetical protein